MGKAPEGERTAQLNALVAGTYFIYGNIQMKMDPFTSKGVEFKSILPDGTPCLAVKISPDTPGEWDSEVRVLDKVEALTRLLEEAKRK